MTKTLNKNEEKFDKILTKILTKKVFVSFLSEKIQKDKVFQQKLNKNNIFV